MTGEVTLTGLGAADRRREGEGAGGAARAIEARDPGRAASERLARFAEEVRSEMEFLFATASRT